MTALRIGLVARCERWRASRNRDMMSTMPPLGWKKPNPVHIECSVRGCSSLASSRGWCPKHYARWKSTGDPLLTKKVGRRPQPGVLCAAPGCGGFAKSRGLCPKHYQRLLYHGSIDIVKNNRGKPVEERFMEKVTKLPNGCWNWTANVSHKGYAMFREGKMGAAHLWAYRHFVGEIPLGLQIDHTCHTDDAACPGGDTCPHRRCVNPAHLEPVTARENSLRGVRRSR